MTGMANVSMLEVEEDTLIVLGAFWTKALVRWVQADVTCWIAIAAAVCH